MMEASPEQKSSRTSSPIELVKGLGLFSSTTIVMGSMIGSGIFIVSADVARQVQAPGLFLLAWILSGLMTVTGAATYGELAAMMPKAGGQYVYLREAFGPLFGFLYGWTLFLVIQTGTLAAVAVAFGKFLGFFYPAVSPQNILVNLGSFRVLNHTVALTFSSEQLIAVLALLVLSAINIFGLRWGAWVQNIFTTLKVGALAGLIMLGLYWVTRRAPVAPVPAESLWSGLSFGLAPLTLVAVAMVGPLFSSDAWNNITFAAGEVINPRRNIPRALFLGTTLVCTIYLACNWVYLRVLPFYGNPAGSGPLDRGIQYAAQDRVGTAAVQAILGGEGAGLMAAAILISTFGCMNGMILAGARVYYAMARDGLFFAPVGEVSPKYRTPAVSLVVQAIWAALLTLTGTYSELLDYVIFAVVLFYILTVVGVFRLRCTRPDAPRPYRAWGYPVVPALYVAGAVAVEWALLTHKPLRSLAGLLIVLLGIPVYGWWRRRGQASQPS